MSCCGKARQQSRIAAPTPANPPEPGRQAWPTRKIQTEFVPFEYTGESILTAVGTITRRLYRFDQPGAVVPVDRRDAPGMRAVPNLHVALLSPQFRTISNWRLVSGQVTEGDH